MEAKENKPCEQGGIDLDQTLPGPDPEDMAAVVISDDDETDLPIDMPQAASTPKVEPAWTRSDPWRTGVHAISSKEVGNRRRGEEHASP